MAHELEIVNGNAQMAYVGDVPWHGLGTKVPADLTPDQFMVKAGLDWDVEKEDILTPSGIKVKINKHLFVQVTVLFLTLLVQVGILYRTQRRSTSLKSM